MIKKGINSESKSQAIALFKSARPWCHHVQRKLALTQGVINVYADPIIRDRGVRGLVRHLNQVIDESVVNRVYFFVDFFFCLDQAFVTKISSRVVKILVTFDDLTLHQFNQLTGCACDLVLSADPISVLKYKEAGLEAEFFPLESSKDLYKNVDKQKTIDVLFFGNSDLADRKEYLDHLMQHDVAVKVIGGPGKYIDPKALVKEICSAKMVINFSKTGYLNKQEQRQGVRFFFQLKGRIIESGLCGTMCLSEYTPSVRLLFGEREVPFFHNKVECLKMIRYFLSDETERESCAKKLFCKCRENYEDQKIMATVEKRIEKIDIGISPNQLANERQLPYWYKKMVLRARIQLLWHRPKDILYELCAIVRCSEKSLLLARLGLLMNTISWIFYRFLVGKRRT